MNFDPDIEKILPHLFNTDTFDPNFKDFLNNNNLIQNLIIENGLKNMRTIFFIIDIIKKIFPVLKDKNETIVNEIIFFIIVISIEFKAGKLTSSDTEKFKGLDSIPYRYSDLSIKKRTKANDIQSVKTYDEEFYEKYLKFKDKRFSFYTTLYNFILSGYPRLDLLLEEIKQKFPEEFSEHINLKNRLLNYNFRCLTDNEFDTLVEKVLTFAEDGLYSIYDYPHIASYYFYFSEEGLINHPIDDVKGKLIKGINISKKYQNDINDDKLKNLHYFINDNAEVEKMKEMVKEIHLEILNKKFNEEADEVLNDMMSGNRLSMANFFNKLNLQDSLLNHFGIKKLAKVLIRSSNDVVFKFTELIKKKYNPGTSTFLLKDKDSISELTFCIQENINNSEISPLKNFLLGELILALEAISTDYEEYYKKNTPR